MSDQLQLGVLNVNTLSGHWMFIVHVHVIVMQKPVAFAITWSDICKTKGCSGGYAQIDTTAIRRSILRVGSTWGSRK